MAKRRRLTPARTPEQTPGTAEATETVGVRRFARETSTGRGADGGALPPIASMTGDIARRAATEEIAAELETARRDGRLAEALPLEAVVADHLIRDRTTLDADEMGALIESLRTRGQQTPIEVTATGAGRYGLISGWRRLEALRRLAADGQGPGTVLAFVRRPETAAEAYLAMIEENEIRADLGFWERGRIVARAVEAGVFETQKEALNGLFGSVSRSKRSKIGSFVLLVQSLDGVLRFPEALSERQGLALAGALKGADPGERDALVARLRKAVSDAAPDTPPAEWALIEACLSKADPGGTGPDRVRAKSRADPDQGAAQARDVHLEARGTGAALTLTLSGPGVDAGFRKRLSAWLKGQAES